MTQIATMKKAVDQLAKSNIGYNQWARWGFFDRKTNKITPGRDADCSSLCGAIIRLGGYNINLDDPFYTGTFAERAKAVGFSVLKFTSLKDVRPGDFLLNTIHHVEYVYDSKQFYSARFDENGNYTGGTPGNQSGKESGFVPYYTYRKGWDFIVRPPQKKKETNVARMASPVEGRIAGPLSEFSLSRRNPATGRVEPHLGLDIAASVGTPIRAPYAGTVIAVGAGILPGRSGDRNVCIQNPDGERQYFGHCDRYVVRVGQKVAMGEIIAYVGARGNVTGPHLHLEIHDKHGVARNPRIDFNFHGIAPGSKYTGTTPKPKPTPPPAPSGRTEADIKAIQRALDAMGYDVGPDDGDYGDRTTREVMNYQRDLNHFAGAGLVVDGDWWTVLQNWFDWVKQLQRALPAWRGVPKLRVDGAYQRVTSNAVKTVQRNNGLHPDGKAQVKTTTFMRKHGSNISNPPKNRP